mgnify:CR=1 FL=1
MASLQNMPKIVLDTALLTEWGVTWNGTQSSSSKPKKAKCFDKKQGMDFCKGVIDAVVAKSLATMLGNVPIETPSSKNLLPPKSNCIEIGEVRIIGGVRSQNFDVAYRPDGVRIAYDSKTLNDAKSIAKNWQNMINDLATEATTVHTRFPYAIVIFVVVLPKQALKSSQEFDLIRTLERLGTRRSVQDQVHLAEAISFVVWDTQYGTIDSSSPAVSSHLRLEKLSEIINPIYLERYKGLPPHDKS